MIPEDSDWRCTRDDLFEELESLPGPFYRQVSLSVRGRSLTEGTIMRHRIGIVGVVVGIGAALAAMVLWQLVDPDFSAPLPLRGSVWGVAGLMCGLLWVVVEFGRDRRRAFRNQRRALRQIDKGGS